MIGYFGFGFYIIIKSRRVRFKQVVSKKNGNKLVYIEYDRGFFDFQGLSEVIGFI